LAPINATVAAIASQWNDARTTVAIDGVPDDRSNNRANDPSECLRDNSRNGQRDDQRDGPRNGSRKNRSDAFLHDPRNGS
jgi:hypothetical protein